VFLWPRQPGRFFLCGRYDKLAGGVVVKGILDLFPDGATGVEIGGQAGHPAAIDRHDGFAKAVAENPSIKVLDYQNPQAWDAAQAQAIAEDMITKYGDQIQFVFCHWDNGATGVINALKAAGMNDVLVFGVDGNAVAFEQVQSWKNYNSIGQNVETIAMKSMELPTNSWLRMQGKFDNIVPFDLITKDTFTNSLPNGKSLKNKSHPEFRDEIISDLAVPTIHLTDQLYLDLPFCTVEKLCRRKFPWIKPF
jgi:ribose transport system substrate-binding protein